MSGEAPFRRHRACARRAVMLGMAGLLAGTPQAARLVHAQTAREPTVPGQPTPDQPAHPAELDRLFAALKAAPDSTAARELEGRIRAFWQRGGSPAAWVLIRQGNTELRAGDTSAALDALDDALVLAPGEAEVWLARAGARFAAGDRAGAMRDLEATLVREPRHFAALDLLSRVAEDAGDWKGALAAWEKLLELDPQTPGGEARHDVLRRHVQGEGI